MREATPPSLGLRIESLSIFTLGHAVKLTHLLVLFHTSAFSNESLQPQLLVLGFSAAQHTQHLQRVVVAQGDGVPQRAQVRVTPVSQVLGHYAVRVKASAVVQ